MNRIFIFAIGGTGSRVLKSLAMQLAAGIVPKTPVSGEPYDIVPIIIDPHNENKDVRECKDILSNYRRIREDIYGDSVKETGFYATRIRTLKDVGTADNTELDIVDEFFFPISEITCDTFRNYVGVNDANVPDFVKIFTKMLYSDEELNTPMQHGFYGQPNLGTVALGAFKESDYYTVLRKAYQPGDKLFFIGSIFGGTGAAGLPMLISSVRQNTEFNSQFSQAPIGALVVMPYFSIEEDEDSKIKQSDFTLKTQTALRYYVKDLDPYVNSMYYLADPFGSTGKDKIKNDKGDGGQQENKSHIAEVIGALSIINFASEEFKQNQTTTKDNKNRVIASNPQKFQFSVMNINPNREIDFTHLDKATNDLIMGPMMKYQIYDRFVFDNMLEKDLTASFAKEKLDSSSITREMKTFSAYYRNWLSELASYPDGHKFIPFRLRSTRTTDFTDEFSSIATRKKKPFGSYRVGENEVRAVCNDIYKECKSTGTPYLFEVLNHPKSLSSLLDKYEIKNYVN